MREPYRARSDGSGHGAYRQAISWARLPALVLLPPALAQREDELRESGVMAAFMPKPLNVAALVDHIRHAHAR